MKGCRIIWIKLPREKYVRLAGVIYILGLEYNLLSLETLHLAGIWTIRLKYGYYILQNGWVVAEGKRYGQIIYLESVRDLNSLFINLKRQAHIVQLMLTQEDKIMKKQALVHSWLGHPGCWQFNHYVKSMEMSKLKLNKYNTILEDSYEICIHTKQVKKQNHA